MNDMYTGAVSEIISWQNRHPDRCIPLRHQTFLGSHGSNAFSAQRLPSILSPSRILPQSMGFPTCLIQIASHETRKAVDVSGYLTYRRRSRPDQSVYQDALPKLPLPCSALISVICL